MKKHHLVMSLSVLIIACGGNNQSAVYDENAPVDGEKLYRNHCSICHGDDGALGFSGAKNLSKTLFSMDEIIGVIKYGSKNGKMRAFGKDAGGELDNKEIKAIAQYVEGFKKENE
jgi:mono/diheme cytochrome c family protein